MLENFLWNFCWGTVLFFFHHVKYVKEVFSFASAKSVHTMSGGLSRLQANADPWNLFPTYSLLAEQANPQKRLFFDTKKMERNIWPYNILISLYFLRKNLCRFYSKSNMMKIKVFSASRKLLKGNAFFRSIFIRTSIYSWAPALSQTCKND